MSRNEGEIDAWFDDALDDLGGLDVLVNNAGIKGPTAPVDDIDYADWRECLERLPRLAFPVRQARRAGDEGPGLRQHHQSSPRPPACMASASARPMRPPNGRSSASPNRSPSSSAPIMCAAMPSAPARCAATASTASSPPKPSSAALPSTSIAKEMTWAQSIQRFVEPDEIADHVPVPRLARRQDGHRPGHRRRWPYSKPSTSGELTHGFRAHRRTGHDRQDHARFRRERALSA